VEAGDFFRQTTEASFVNLTDEAAQIKATIEKKLTKVIEDLDEADANVTRASIAGLGRGAISTEPQVQEIIAAVEKLNAAKQQGVQLDLFDLDTLKAQADELQALVAVRERLIATGEAQPALWSETSQPLLITPATQTAAAERAAAEAAAATSAAIAQASEDARLFRLDVENAAMAQRENVAAAEELLGPLAQADALMAAYGAGLRVVRDLQVEQDAALQAAADAQKRQVATAGEHAVAFATYSKTAASGAYGTPMPRPASAAEGGAAAAYDAAYEAANKDLGVTDELAASLMKEAEAATGAERAFVALNIQAGELAGFMERDDIATEALSQNFQRLGMAEAESSNAMREHGALTTEWIGALMRGETTVSELGYQIGATTAKFAGWVAAAAGTYAVLGAFVEFGKGAIESANGVQQLKRTIDGLNTQQAAQNIRQLSQDTDVSMTDAANAIFAYSRTFHSLPDATEAAYQGLSALRLDNVSLTDSVALSTSMHQQFGLTLSQLGGVYNMISAAQREYNARISDMVPALSKSMGAVKAAGGSYEQLIQIITAALRLNPGMGGAQIGTALYRAAATQVPKNASALVSRFGLGADINPLTGQGNITQLIIDAINKSATMTGPMQRQLANLIFGERYGGLSAALFGSNAAALLGQVTGRPGAGGPGAITPQATQGAMARELATQLAQVRNQMSQFIFSLQRLGSALVSTGALAPFAMILRGVVGAIDSFRQFVDVINGLPGPLRETIVVLAEARLAFLALTRTRFGSSLPGAQTIAKVPVFGGIETNRMRRELTAGISNNIETITADLNRTQDALVKSAASQQYLSQQRATLLASVADGEQMSETQQARLVEIDRQLVAEAAEQQGLQAQLVSQTASREQQQAQLKGLTMTRRNREKEGYTPAKIASMAGDSGSGIATAGQAAKGEGDAMGVIALASATAKQKWADAAARIKEGSIATERLTDQTRVFIADADGTIAVLDAETSVARKLPTALEAMGTTLGSFGEALGGMLGAIDPMMLALIALPTIFSALSAAAAKTNSAGKQVAKLMAEPTSDFQNMNQWATQMISALDAQHKQQVANSKVPLTTSKSPAIDVALGKFWTGLGKDVAHTATSLATGAYRDAESILPDNWRRDASRGATRPRPAAPTAPAKVSGTALEGGIRGMQEYTSRAEQQLAQEAPQWEQTTAGRKRLNERIAALEQAGKHYASVALAGNPQQIATAVTLLDEGLQNTAATAVTATAATQKIDTAAARYAQQWAQMAGVAPATSEAYLQALSSSETVFGTAGQLQKAQTEYSILVDQYRNSMSDSTSMQKLQQDQSAITSAMTKHVQDLLDAAKGGVSMATGTADIDKAITASQQEKQWIEQSFAQAIAYAKRFHQGEAAIAQLQQAESQQLAQWTTENQTAIQAALSLQESQGQVAVSAISGISPEADIARASKTVQNDRKNLAKAKALHADPNTIASLQNTLDTDQNSLYKSQVDNADAIATAAEQGKVSAITGITPQDDIARAKQIVQNKTADYQRAITENKGPAAIQAAWNDLMGADNQLKQTMVSAASQIAQNATGVIDSNTALAQSQTTDPIKQAADQTAGDLKKLATIKPDQFATYAQYLAASQNAKAKVNEDYKNQAQTNADTDIQNWQFLLKTQQISDQQYIGLLNSLLKQKNLTAAERQTIMGDIYDASNQTGISLNVGDIKLPTSYEIRRAVAGGMTASQRAKAGKQQPPTPTSVVNQPTTNYFNVVVQVQRAEETAKVIQAWQKAVKTNKVGMQASGMI
jgi:Phage-related minor tail protein